jgi:hypothetical protein
MHTAISSPYPNNLPALRLRGLASFHSACPLRFLIQESCWTVTLVPQVTVQRLI